MEKKVIESSWYTIVTALELAATKGAFDLKQAAATYQALESIKPAIEDLVNKDQPAKTE